MKRLDRRIARSKRSGKVVLIGVLMVSAVLGVVLVQGLLLALEEEHWGLMTRGLLGLALLVGVDVFSLLAIRRQHRMLDEAREELRSLVRPSEPPCEGDGRGDGGFRFGHRKEEMT